MLYIIGFIVCAAIIFFAGKKLSFYGDLLADKTGMSKGWVGLILMASVTSLPELMVGISSSAIVKSADLAVGDILGSCAFNMGILAILDVFTPKHKSLFGLASPTHMLNAGLGIILIALVGMAMFLPHDVAVTPWIALSSLILMDASEFHLVSIMSTIIMTAVVIIGLSFRAKGKRFLMAWDALLIFIIYIMNLYILYRLTA
jgi:cation:H+ antiporter